MEISGKDADSSEEDDSATEAETADETTESEYTEQTENRGEDENTSDSDPTMSETTAEMATGAVTDETVTVQIDPVIRTLTEYQASNEGESTEAFVKSAIRTYLAEALRGNEPWSETTRVTERKLTIDADPALEQLIATTAANNDESDAKSFVVRTLCDAIGLDIDDRELPIGALEEMDELIVATTENDSCPHEAKDEVVQAALERRVL
ncbi:metallo-beta-lactamase superfamily domain-containing protein [Natrinema pallidum DSM 3751]|uniref:Metallo-beta-lactamase superfamily domain-containing protein n=2 Tax=Natrinema pallidum TaxID=69527 RepID=L9ZEX3_9EURY|nr:metallo-beta-lactamase superfamily domain-containing protein [Natrinema pallidum DSM 3751]